MRFASWVKDDRLTLDANPDYWGGKPDFDRLIVRSIPETAPRVAALIKRTEPVGERPSMMSQMYVDTVPPGRTTQTISLTARTGSGA